MNTQEKTLTVEIPTKNNASTRVELAVPFYGKVPDEKRWIKISGDRPDIVTISISPQDGVDLFHWFSVEYVGIEDFVPCQEIDWEIAKLLALKTIMEDKP